MGSKGMSQRHKQRKAVNWAPSISTTRHRRIKSQVGAIVDKAKRINANAPVTVRKVETEFPRQTANSP